MRDEGLYENLVNDDVAKAGGKREIGGGGKGGWLMEK